MMDVKNEPESGDQSNSETLSSSPATNLKFRFTVELKCQYCRRLCFSNDELHTHERTHLDNKKLRCPQCLKGFARRSYLGEHMLIHLGLFPWKCEYCPKKFALRCNLSRHLRIHTGEKPYKCESCSKRFTLKKNMQEHKLTHTKEKPFECPQCSVKFSRRSSLVRHVRTHTHSRTFECAHCGQYFPWKYSLQKHLLTKHNDSPSEKGVTTKRRRRAKTAKINRAKMVKKREKKSNCAEEISSAACAVLCNEIKVDEGPGCTKIKIEEDEGTTRVFLPSPVHTSWYKFEGAEGIKQESSSAFAEGSVERSPVNVCMLSMEPLKLEPTEMKSVE